MINILPGGLGLDAAVVAPLSTWDTSNLYGTFTFSNSNRTAVGTPSGGPGAYVNALKGTASHATGKFYFEVSIDVVSNHSPTYDPYSTSIGVVNGSWGSNTIIGGSSGLDVGLKVDSSSTFWSIYQDAIVSPVKFGTGIAAGQIIGVAIDSSSGNVNVWFRLNANWLNGGTPSTSFNPSGPDVSSVWPTSALTFPAASEGNGQFTLNVGNAAFANAPPSGFVAWG